MSVVRKHVSVTCIVKIVTYKSRDIFQEIVPMHRKAYCHPAENLYENIVGNIHMYTRWQTWRSVDILLKLPA